MRTRWMASLFPGLSAMLASALMLTACGGGGSDATGTSGTMGTLRLAMTDAPACGYDHVYVTVASVRVHQSATAGDTDPGWQVVAMPSMPARVDLLNLTNGVLMELGQTVLPAGNYTQLRLILSPTGNQAPYANAVAPTGAGEMALTTPSAQQTGIKLNINVKVEPNQLADFVLDFDACKSVVSAGNSGKFILKPVIAVMPRVTTGMAVDGYVSNWTSGTAVSLQQNGQVLRSTIPNSNGYFVLPYLPAAGTNFDLVIAAPDRTTQVVTAVPVDGATITHVSAAATPIALTGSAARTVSGAATAASTIPDATVAALQTVAPGKDVEIASRQVDGLNGSYQLTLATAAAQTAPYVLAPAPLVWTSYAASAAKYTIRSSVPGAPVQSSLVDLTGGSAVVNFSY